MLGSPSADSYFHAPPPERSLYQLPYCEFGQACPKRAHNEIWISYTDLKCQCIVQGYLRYTVQKVFYLHLFTKLFSSIVREYTDGVLNNQHAIYTFGREGERGWRKGGWERCVCVEGETIYM